MLKSLNFSQLLSFGLHDLAKITLQVYGTCEIHRCRLEPFIEDVRQSLVCYEETFQRRVISCVMERKTIQASKRDEAYIAFYRYVEACCHRTSQEYNLLGTEIMSVLQKHGWAINSDGHPRQTSSLPELIRELEHHHLETIEQLGASGWFDELVRAQAEFNVLSDEKKIGAFKEISLRETRPLLENALRSLFEITDRLYQAAPDEELGRIVMNLNNAIRKLTNKAASELCTDAFNSN